MHSGYENALSEADRLREEVKGLREDQEARKEIKKKQEVSLKEAKAKQTLLTQQNKVLEVELEASIGAITVISGLHFLLSACYDGVSERIAIERLWLNAQSVALHWAFALKLTFWAQTVAGADRKVMHGLLPARIPLGHVAVSSILGSFCVI